MYKMAFVAAFRSLHSEKLKQQTLVFNSSLLLRMRGEDMLLTVVQRALGKYWLIPFAVLLPLMIAYFANGNALHWIYVLCLLAVAFAGVLVIAVPIEYHAAKKERGNEF
jgi:hypothetical protein